MRVACAWTVTTYAFVLLLRPGASLPGAAKPEDGWVQAVRQTALNGALNGRAAGTSCCGEKFLGVVSSATACQTLCMAMAPSSNGTCTAFTWHGPDQGVWSHMCYARVDGEWQPQNASGHTSGRYVGAGGGKCATDDDCWGAGICRDFCICDPGFRGLRCQELDVLPASTKAAYESPTAATWGASVLPSDDNKIFHMWVSEMAGGCGLNSWEPKSQVRIVTNRYLSD